MIDPKLNDLPVEGALRRSEATRNVSTEEEEAEQLRRSRAGLSINDTVAAGANMSVGARGVAASGTEAGAGAGAGTTLSTPVSSANSPSPTIAPGARGSGTTTLGSAYAQPEASTHPSSNTQAAEISQQEIAARAYCSWCDRGRPLGSPEIDWRRAEEELRRERAGRARAASV